MTEIVAAYIAVRDSLDVILATTAIALGNKLKDPLAVADRLLRQ